MVDAHHDGARRFEALLGQMEPLLEELRVCEPHRRDIPPAAPEESGVYLFTEGDKPIYVGRTRNFRRRWGEHTQPSSPENKAPFAFNIARLDASGDGFDITGPRKEVEARPGFRRYFLAAKLRVRAMDFRFVRIANPAVSSIFEVYASLSLGTEGEFNLFETH